MVSVAVSVPGTTRRCARPKSTTFTRSPALTITLAAFRSPVNDVTGMRMCQRIGHLPDQPYSLADCERRLQQAHVQVGAVDELHRDERTAVVLSDLYTVQM